MSITTQPTDTLNAAQNPLILELSVAIADTGEELKNAVVTVTDGTSSVTFRRTYDTQEVVLFTRTATWMIDLAPVVRSFFADTGILSAFGSLNDEYLANDPLLSKDIDVTIDYEKINIFGLLEDIGSTDTATTFKVINAGRQWDEDFTLSPFYAASGRKFLTNQTGTRVNCRDAAAFLQFWSLDITTMQVETYNAAGALLDSQIADVDPYVLGDIVSVGVGVPNINNITTWLNTAVTIDDTVAYYEVTLGTRTVAFPPAFDTAITETVRFTLVDCCDFATTFYWLNRLGGVDSYTFDQVRQVRGEARSEIYGKFADVDHLRYDYGRQKFNSQESELLVCTSRRLNEARANFLRELQTSTRVYVERGGNLYACVILDAEDVITDTNTPYIARQITAQLSIDKIIQNNV